MSVGWIVDCSQVVLVNLPGEIWSVYSSVTFSRYPQFIIHELWELLIPMLQGMESIFGLRHIIVLPGLVILGNGISHTSWTFNV